MVGVTVQIPPVYPKMGPDSNVTRLSPKWQNEARVYAVFAANIARN
jgi:hypothetical protein